MAVLIVTKYQAAVIYAALQIFSEVHEAAAHHGNEINDDKNYTDVLLTCYNSLEEAAIIQQQINIHFGITSK